MRTYIFPFRFSVLWSVPRIQSSIHNASIESPCLQFNCDCYLTMKLASALKLYSISMFILFDAMTFTEVFHDCHVSVAASLTGILYHLFRNDLLTCSTP